MKNIGLIDVDNLGFPNLALMKISAYHKNNGDNVEFVDYWNNYDTVYMSKVFTFTNEDETVINSKNIIRGGTGYDLKNKLDDNIESMYPDYSIYPNIDYAIGFLTRGCSRGCPFCIVNEKEGSTHKVADLKDIWRGQNEIKLLDPNILEYKGHVDLLNQLIESKSNIDFTQGVDARLLNEHNTDLIMKIRIKRIHFAYDMMKNSKILENNLRLFMETTKWKRGKVTVYILSNFDTTIDEDLYRINFVKSIGATPYLMLYDKHNLPRGHALLHLQRWCNAPQILFSTEFDDYLGGKKNIIY